MRFLVSGREAPLQNGLLGVEPVLGLVEHHRARPVDDLVRHLLAAMRRQAVEEQGTLGGTRHQRRVDAIGLEQPAARRRVVLPHRHPGIGEDRVGTPHRRLRVGGRA